MKHRDNFFAEQLAHFSCNLRSAAPKSRKKTSTNPNDLLGLGENRVGESILTKGPRNPQTELRDGQRVGLKVPIVLHLWILFLSHFLTSFRISVPPVT